MVIAVGKFENTITVERAKNFGLQTLFLLPEWKFPGNSYFGGVQPMVAPVREFPGNFLTGAAES